jgi:hypothetical protein
MQMTTLGGGSFVVEVCVLVAALAVGVIAQGGFYSAGHLLVALLAGVAVLVRTRSAVPAAAERVPAFASRSGRQYDDDALPQGLPAIGDQRDPWRWAVLIAGGALAAWALARGLWAGADLAAVGAVATVGCLLAGY